jgi:4'-phosphopantetheinyl transferase
MTRGENLPITWVLVEADEMPEGDHWLSETERRDQEGLRIPKRRADWRLGRWAAKRALVAWWESGAPQGPAPDPDGEPIEAGSKRSAQGSMVSPFGDPDAVDRLEIHTAEDGAPEARLDGGPLPVVLSLSHRAGSALAVTAPARLDDGIQGAALRLGCDLEFIEPRSPWFLADYLRPDEREVVRAAPENDAPLLANLFWSAKESAAKALRRGLTVDTWRLAVELRGGASVFGPGWTPFTVRFQEARRTRTDEGWFLGGWRREGEFLVTVAAGGIVRARTRRLQTTERDEHPSL